MEIYDSVILDFGHYIYIYSNYTISVFVQRLDIIGSK